MGRTTAKQTALTAVFAALIVIATRLPGIPILGGMAAGGGQIELSTILYPLTGIVLGPWLGMIAVLVGNLIAWIIPTSTIFGLLMIPAGSIAALIGGSLTRQGKWSNWKLSATVLALLIAAWYITPTGRSIPLYPILHWTALGLLLLTREKIATLSRDTSRTGMLLGVGLCSFIATMGEHMFGGLVWMAAAPFYVDLKLLRDALRNLMGPLLGAKWVTPGGLASPDDPIGMIFMATLFPIPIYPAERLLITAGSTLLSVAVIRMIGWGRLSA